VSPDRPGTAASPSRGGYYLEHLRIPLRWWALATMFWATTLIAFLVATPAWVALLSIGSLTALSVAVLVSYGAAQVSVADGSFRAGRASIPVALLSDPEALDAAATKRVAGVEADARAYLLLRPYVDRAVRVRVDDPADPTPYWLVSTRHPETLVQVLAGEIASAAGARHGR
jgi:hypothetical protein